LLESSLLKASLLLPLKSSWLLLTWVEHWNLTWLLIIHILCIFNFYFNFKI
jgi:hypothetical protein